LAYRPTCNYEALTITGAALHINARELRQGDARRLVCLDRDFGGGSVKVFRVWFIKEDGPL
jgi:hypothetical protein